MDCGQWMGMWASYADQLKERGELMPSCDNVIDLDAEEDTEDDQHYTKE